MREPFVLTTPPDIRGYLSPLPDEANHLVNVLRFRAGDTFTAFDGAGHGWRAEIESISKKNLTAKVVEALPQIHRETMITLYLGTVKGSRMEWAVEKSAELGVARLVPIETRYGVVEPGSGRLRRWEAVALAAVKQSRRFTLMEILPPVPLPEALERSNTPGICFDLLGDEISSATAASKIGKTAQLSLWIGPEGGFSAEESSQIRQKGILPVSLGSHPLRTETAVVAALSALQATGLLP